MSRVIVPTVRTNVFNLPDPVDPEKFRRWEVEMWRVVPGRRYLVEFTPDGKTVLFTRPLDHLANITEPIIWNEMIEAMPDAHAPYWPRMWDITDEVAPAAPKT